MPHTIHIGQAIDARIKELGLQKKHVAEQMAMSRQNLNNIFNSDTIRTDQLEKFCEVLEKNFFLLYKGLGNDINEHGDTQNITIQIDKEGHLKDSNTAKKLDVLYRKMNEISAQLEDIMKAEAIASVQKTSK
jgi:DNA-binding Xre family transcriptional regulator